jgi:2-desacetyl-2-hydroxyethyl bacteriochlorophyllide A dehydrogenase
MLSYSLCFTAPRQVVVQQQSLPPPTSGQVLVKTLLSAISPGTEMLIYRGEFPTGIPVDVSIAALAGDFSYPLRYGYSAVGRVAELGEGVNPAWLGRLVFAFQPHASLFVAEPELLIPVPEGISAENAAFLPNMETAVNFLLDGAPRIGERVVVLGQGIVGLLTTALLARFPLASLVTLDRYPLRRQASLQAGAIACLDPALPAVTERLLSLNPRGADLVYELSGAPAALDLAIAVVAFSGQVVVGSWYGQKRASLDLGGRFHRSRIRLVSSQVSSIAPELSGRWTVERRFSQAWKWLVEIDPERWITHRFPLAQSADAYRLLDEDPAAAIQVLLTYDDPQAG